MSTVKVKVWYVDGDGPFLDPMFATRYNQFEKSGWGVTTMKIEEAQVATEDDIASFEAAQLRQGDLPFVTLE